MNIFSTLKIAVRALKANKMRTGLTVLGMVIGIASVILVFSAGDALNSLITGQVESFGTNIIQAEVRVPSTKTGQAKDNQTATAMAQGVQVTTMTLDDLDALLQIENVTGGYGMVTAQEQAGYQGELKKSYIFGVGSDFIDIDQGEVENGRFFTDAEDRSLQNVVVLGSKVKDKLFGQNDAVGQYIRVRKGKYKVIGVMKERGGGGFIDLDSYIYLPVRTVQKKILGIDHVLSVIVAVEDIGRSEFTAEEMRQVLRDRHDIIDPVRDDFRVTTMAEMMETLGTITSAVTWLLIAIVAISLVVSGVGITNVMYVVVSERTPEIGLRKAVGARYRDIMRQFLFEAVAITTLAGVIGSILGTLLSIGMYLGASSFGIKWEFTLPLSGYLVSLGFSLVLGVAFGLYPARRAAQMDPIAALRNE